MIDPAFWESHTVAKLGRCARLTFIGLFSNADDQGRMKAHPALLRSRLYPYDDISIADIEEELQGIAATGAIQLYEVAGARYLQITGWWKYQHPRWAWPSDIPAPEGWLDRVRYRQGNKVMEDNWEGESTVVPQWDDSGTDAKPAPRGRDSGSSRDSGSDRENADADAGASEPPTPTTFREWHELVTESSNPNATLRYMHETLFPGRKPPDYAYLGRVARQVGGPGRLADLLWQCAPRPPTGEILPYCIGIAKGQREPDKPPEPAGFEGIRRFRERMDQHGDNRRNNGDPDVSRRDLPALPDDRAHGGGVRDGPG